VARTGSAETNLPPMSRPTLAEELREHATHLLILLPGMFMLSFFFIIPILIAVWYSFLDAVPTNGGIPPNLTFDNYTQVFTQSLYVHSFVRTAIYATIATFVSLVVTYPVAYYLARRSRHGGVILLLILIPFMTSIVLRVLAWKIILGTTANGVLNSVLLNLGIISKPIAILYTGTAIVFGLVYLSIPFMLLPLYAVLGKVP
jgi:spermidine/putrescine transport system permease protein